MTVHTVVVATAGALALAAGGAACGDSPHAMPICGMTQSGALHPHAQCGPMLDFTPINDYHGEITMVQDREDAVVLIDGVCTGTLIAAQAGPVVLTAGHCVAVGGRSLIVFNDEDNPDGDPLITGGVTFEQASVPDYALLKLDQLPAVVPTPLTTRSSDLLAVIQHPRGKPKVIAEGRFAAACDDQVYYTDLDTLVGSSGAGVLTRNGYLLAVHSEGDCAADGSGSNHGFTAEAIVAASAYLQSADLADR
jgi:hypothetical protein